MTTPIARIPLPVRALIVDDEPIARRGVRLLLARLTTIDVAGEAGTGGEAVELITQLKPDLVFLDVQMPEIDGFQVIHRVGVAAMPPVIFITAYDTYALKAFEVTAIDYLLKPYDDARFHAAVARACETIRLREAQKVQTHLGQLLQFLNKAPPLSDADGPTGVLADRIVVKSAGEVFFLKMEEIDWVEAEGDYMVLHSSGKTHLLRETMAKLEAKLDPKRFIRIHRSTIVNIDRVRKLSPSFLGEYAVILHDGTKLKLSRTYQERLRKLLNNAF